MKVKQPVHREEVYHPTAKSFPLTNLRRFWEGANDIKGAQHRLFRFRGKIKRAQKVDTKGWLWRAWKPFQTFRWAGRLGFVIQFVVPFLVRNRNEVSNIQLPLHRVITSRATTRSLRSWRKVSDILLENMSCQMRSFSPVFLVVFSSWKQCQKWPKVLLSFARRGVVEIEEEVKVSEKNKHQLLEQILRKKRTW